MATTRRVHIPSQMVISFPATQENPSGRIVTLNPGYMDLDDEMAAHPILSKLIPMDDFEVKRSDKVAKAQEEYDKTMAAASKKLAVAKAEAEKEYTDHMQEQTEKRSARESEAIRRGFAFNEPHPDPETQRAMALTAPAGQYISPAVLAQVPETAQVAVAQEPLPTEEEATKKMAEEVAQRAKAEESKDEGGVRARRSSSDDDDNNKGRAKTHG